MVTPTLWPVVLFGATALAWILYFRWKDAHRPEPWVLTLLCTGGGLISAALSLAGYEGLDALGVSTSWEQLAEGDAAEAGAAALRIGAVEEVAKLLPVIILASLRREFDEVLDGIVYAAFAAIGFALAESVVLLVAGVDDLWSVLGRALTAPLSHALFSAPAGLGLSLALLRRRWGALLAGLAASVLLHALYNALLARPEVPQITAALVVGVIWIWLLRTVPKLSPRHQAVGL